MCERDLYMEYICMRTRKTPHTHEERERERERERGRERDQQGLCVGCVRQDCRRERERERESRSPGEGEVAFYASKTDINHVSK